MEYSVGNNSYQASGRDSYSSQLSGGDIYSSDRLQRCGGGCAVCTGRCKI